MVFTVRKPEDVVFYTDSDEKSIILLYYDKMLYASEGQYGGFIVRTSEVDNETVLERAKAFFVEPKKSTKKIKELDEKTRKKLFEVLEALPDDVRSAFYYNDDQQYVDVIEYEYTEVNQVVKKKTDRYIVLDFEPKPGAKKLKATAIRLTKDFHGSRRRPEGEKANRTLKEWRLKYPDNTVIQKQMYARKISFKHSEIILKVVIEAPSDLLPQTPSISDEELEEIEIDVDELKKEWGLETKAVEKKEETERAEEGEQKLTTKEVEKLVEKYLRDRGLLRLRLVVFKLPTEYIKSKTKMVKSDDGYVEEKRLSLEPSRFRTLRKKFYNTLHKLAWKSEVGWVLFRDADLKPIHDCIAMLNDLLREYNIPQERYIEIIEAYVPKDFIERELTRYIIERKTAYEEIARKINEQADKLKNIKALKKHLEEIEEELKALEKELRYIKTQ